MSTLMNHKSGVSWGAILAGASSAASLSFLLLLLGFGLGLSAVSPWANSGASLAVIGISSILWVSFTQIAASGLGGYIAGRLRTRWDGVHNDEVYFRDTAHGLVTWSISTMLAATLFASTLSSVFSTGVSAGAQVGGGAIEAVASGAASVGDSYFSDALLRKASNNSQLDSVDPEVRSELSTILMRSLAEGELRDDDSQYISNLVSRYTGISPTEASNRVSQIYQRAQQAAAEVEAAAKEAADTARKTAAVTALWMVVALLCGAFTAALSATWGGHRRDALPTDHTAHIHR